MIMTPSELKVLPTMRPKMTRCRCFKDTMVSNHQTVISVTLRQSYKEQIICKMGANQSSGSNAKQNIIETANFDFRYSDDVRRKPTYYGQPEEVTSSFNNNEPSKFWEKSSSYWDQSWPSSCQGTSLTNISRVL